MKARNVAQYVAQLPSEMDGLTEEHFQEFMNWRGAYTQLDKRISRLFKPAVYEMTGFDDEHRPEEETVQCFDIGGLTFRVTTKPTTKRPSYRDVAVELKNYLSVLGDQYGRDIRRREVVTIDGEPYVSVGDVKERIADDMETYTSGCEGVSYTIVPTEPEVVVQEVPECLPIQFDRDYSQPTDFNARVYVKAENLKKEGNRRANSFKKQVMKESQAVGEFEGTIMVVEYAFPDWDIIHQVEKRKTPKYKDIIEAFIREAPQRLTTRSSVGDLVIAEAVGYGGSSADSFREKGFLTQAFEADYNPTRRDERVFVRLNGLQSRLEQYQNELVTDGMEQNFAVVIK